MSFGMASRRIVRAAHIGHMYVSLHNSWLALTFSKVGSLLYSVDSSSFNSPVVHTY